MKAAMQLAATLGKTRPRVVHEPYYVVDYDTETIYGQFFKYKSAEAVAMTLRKISDMFLEVGTNVHVMNDPADMRLKYAIAKFKRGTEDDIQRVENVLPGLVTGTDMMQ